MSKDKIIKQKELIRVLKDNYKNESDTRFVFLLGAGASVQSGIPSAKELSQNWIKEIEEDLGKELFEEWKKLVQIDTKNIASSYTKVFAKRFEHNPKNGYETLQKLMENIQPSVGYIVLAQILENTKHNFVITTNFDSLIEDALFLFTAKRPLVCGHESLASFIQLNSTRPTIIKVHRDILLDPYNTDDKTCSLNEPFQKALSPIISNSPIIILGYGGNDESIMSLLETEQREPIYWCMRNVSNIPEKIINLLKENDRLVEINGFDEFMVALHAKVYDFESIKSLSSKEDKDSLIVKNAYEKVKIYKKELQKFQEEVKNSTSNEFKEDAKSIFSDWWSYQLKIYEETNNEKKEELYLKGIESLNSSELMGNYAVFLHAIKEDYENAEKYYLKALDIESNDPVLYSNYALFLGSIKKDYEKTEKYFLKALNIQHNNANFNGNYAQFLLSQNEKDKALPYLDKAFTFVTYQKDLLSELYFYKMAHFIEEYENSKKELDKLLEDSPISENWDFSGNIKQAIKDNHPHIDELKEYAKRISGIDYSDI